MLPICIEKNLWDYSTPEMLTVVIYGDGIMSDYYFPLYVFIYSPSFT